MPGSDDFEARRRRHLARHAMTRPETGDAEARGRDASGGRSLVLPMIGLLGMMGVGLFALSQAGPTIAKASEPWMAAFSTVKEAGLAEKRAPAREDGPEGRVFRSPALAHAGTREIDLSAVVSGLEGSGARPEAVPGALVPLEARASCAAPTVAPEGRVHGVRLGGGTRAGGVTALSEGQIAQQVLANVTALTDPPPGPAAPRLGTETGGTRLSAVDVVVTETGAPVHLVLQSARGDVLWHLHVAEGARLSGVTLVSPSHAAIAGHEGVPVELLRAGEGCVPLPERAPAPHWRLVEDAAHAPALGALLAERQARHDAYAAWYEDAFGLPAEARTIRHARAAHVLVGPVPETPVPYTPLAERTAAVTPADHLLHGTLSARDAEARALHEALLMRAAGGRLEALDPAPVRAAPL